MASSPSRPGPSTVRKTSTGLDQAKGRPAALALRRAVVWAVGALALGAVFLAYLKPETMVTLANMVWSCF
jgi:hypothetical protein